MKFLKFLGISIKIGGFFYEMDEDGVFLGELILNDALTALNLIFPQFEEISYRGPTEGFVGFIDNEAYKIQEGVIGSLLVRTVWFSFN